MNTFNKVSAEMLEELRAALGERFVSTDVDKLETYKTDEEANPKSVVLKSLHS